MSKEKQIWDIVSHILGNYGEEVDGISRHESEKAENGELHRKIYAHHEYCFELSCYTDYDSEDIDNAEDGCVYYFSEPWDGFYEAGIDKAIKILENISNKKIYDTRTI